MDGNGSARRTAHVTVQGLLRREIEWGYQQDGGSAWARCHVDVTAPDGQSDEDGFEVLLEGQLVLDAVKRCRPGDLVLVSGELVVGRFQTEDGVPGRLLEINADSMGVVLPGRTSSP
jgi:single-stranded DNA-binding protein